MNRNKSLLLGGLLAAALLTTVGISRADDPEPGSTVAVPYAATLLDAQGDPLDAEVDVQIRVFTDAADEAELLYAEQHGSVPVKSGHLYLVIGTGEAQDGHLSAARFLEHADAAVEIEIDGELLAGRQRLGRVPRALTADAVSASDVRWGGEHGYVPAEAVARNVTLNHRYLLSGQNMDPVPSGWTCDYAAELSSPWQAVDVVGDVSRPHERWIAHVGNGAVGLEDGLTVVFPALPGLGPRGVRIARAWTEGCEPGEVGCEWQHEFVTGLPVQVTALCFPKLAELGGEEDEQMP